MSTTIGDTAGYIRTCSECETAFKTTQSPRDEYCSHSCYFETRGRGALNQIANDHRICASCWKYIKECHSPSEDYMADACDPAAIRNAELRSDDDYNKVLDLTAVDRTTRPAGIRSDGSMREFCFIGEQFATPNTRYLYGSSGPWVCECGNVDLSEHNELLANQDTDAMVLALLDRLREFYEKGAIQQEPDRSTFFEYFEDREKSLRTSVGACLYRG